MRSMSKGNSTQSGRREFLEAIDRALHLEERDEIVSEIESLMPNLKNFGFLGKEMRDIVEGDISQIRDSRTSERAKYYIRRLKKEITEVEYAPNSSINIRLWKGYSDILTDSLWLFDRRARNEVQSAWYWGNFVPQIPYQLMMRYTRENEWVLDPFCGSGTTLYEAHRLNRNAVGIDINPETVSEVNRRLAGLGDSGNTITTMTGNSMEVDYGKILESLGISAFNLAILHPPYHDIIKFTSLEGDLSNSPSTEEFLGRISTVAGKVHESLSEKGTMGLVIGDRYSNGEVVPLGFLTMESVISQGFRLKGIIVKDIDNTRAKRTSTNLWRYRALKSGIFVFRHEYVFVFQKK